MNGTDPEFSAKEEAAIEEKLQAKVQSLSPVDLQSIERISAELSARQDEKIDASMLPRLHLSDVDRNLPFSTGLTPQWVEASEKQVRFGVACHVWATSLSLAPEFKRSFTANKLVGGFSVAYPGPPVLGPSSHKWTRVRSSGIPPTGRIAAGRGSPALTVHFSNTASHRQSARLRPRAFR